MTTSPGPTHAPDRAGSAASPPAAERAYVVTKELILTGQLAAGSLLSEGEIADRLALSRTPVREAFLRLQGEELLRLIPKRGAIVVPVPAGEAADVLDVRLALETAAARRLIDSRAGGASAALIDALTPARDLLTAQRRHAKARDVPAFAESDEAFHRAIVEAGGNAIASRFYATLADRQRRMAIGALTPQPARLNTLVTEHRALLKEIETGDLDGFATALRRHLTGTHASHGSHSTHSTHSVRPPR